MWSVEWHHFNDLGWPCMPKLLFYYWFEPNCFRKYVTDLRLIFKIGSPTGIDDNDCCEIELRIAIAQGTLPWQPIFVYSIHTFFSSQWSMCNTLCAFSHVIHEVDRRPQRFLLTTPIHRETDTDSWERTFPIWTFPSYFPPILACDGMRQEMQVLRCT